MPTTNESVQQAAKNARERIIADLSDRSGVLEGIDGETMQEIHDRIEFIVANEVTTAVLAERKRAADVARNWGGAPPRVGGRRDQLAAQIEEG